MSEQFLIMGLMENYSASDRQKLFPARSFRVVYAEGPMAMRLRRLRFRLVVIVSLMPILLHLPLISAQSQTGPGPSFNNATVFPTDIGCRDQTSIHCPSGTVHVTVTSPFQSDGRYRACGDFEKFLRDAFNTGNKIKLWNVPAWGGRILYDIDAKGSDLAGVEPLRLMLRDLLGKRFRLKFHFETRMIDVYTLKVAESGHKLQPAKDDTGAPLIEVPREPVEPCDDHFRPGQMRSSSNDGSGLSVLEARAVNLNKFADFLVNATGCTVVDKTGVEGLFDIKLRYSPYRALPPSVSCPPSLNPPASKPSDPSVFSALEEVGLKLELAKIPLELLVIDDAQKPECTDSSGVIPCP
jgi:uncharacterized protein (TIGR03435 family)